MAGSVIGALRVSLTAETAQFDKGIDRSKTKLRQFDADTRKMAGSVSDLGRDFGTGFGPVGTVLDKIGAAGLVAGAGVGAAVVAFQGMQAALKFADDLDATATKIGVTAEQFQELTFAAKENDITTEALSQSLQGLNVALGAYKSGVGDAKVKKVFEALGITPESLADVNNAADFLPMLADKIKALGSTAERVKIAKMMGVEDLVPLLMKGGDEIDRLAAKARDLGLVMSNELTAKAADANRELEVMGDYISAHLSIAFAGLATWLNDAAKDFQPLIDKIREATQAMREYQAGRGRDIAARQRERAAAMEAANGGRATRQSALLRSDAEKYDPTQFGDSAISDRMGTQASFDALRPQGGAGGSVASGRGSSGGGSRSRGGAKPRYTGKLPDYILALIAEGRFTEASIRERYPDGSFPMQGGVILPDPVVVDSKTTFDAADLLANARRIDESPTGFRSSADRVGDVTSAIEATKDQNREAFREMFSGGLMAALRDGEDGVREWMRRGAERGLEQALNNLADLIFKLFSDSMGGGSGSGIGSSIGQIVSAIFGGGNSSSIPGFATGGNFTVGGSGGVDSQLVRFRATPGEMVNISHGNDNGSRGSVTFDMRGAVVTQDLLNQMNQIAANGDAQVLGAVAREKQRGDKASRYTVARARR
jgi:hypothetical protein